MAKANEKPDEQNPPNDQNEKTALKGAPKVRVIKENGTLGPELLKKGDVTENPEYVALLKTRRGRKLVEAVK